jgi:preprotein translocase subunit SecE
MNSVEERGTKMENAQVQSTAAPDQSSGNWLKRATDYWDDLRAEMRRVNWPTRDQVIATTGVVIAAVFFFSLYFFAVDFGIGYLINKLFASLAKS